MAKIKNTGKQPRGFFDEHGVQHTVPPGGEIEINMSEADYEKCEEVAKSEDPAPYEISGGAGGAKKPEPKHTGPAEAGGDPNHAAKTAEHEKAATKSEHEKTKR